MKVKLLIRLRNRGRGKVTIYSTTTGSTVGMSYGYDEDDYAHLYDYGDTAQDVKEKAGRVYMDKHMDYFRRKYAKYSRKYKHRNKV